VLWQNHQERQKRREQNAHLDMFEAPKDFGSMTVHSSSTLAILPNSQSTSSSSSALTSSPHSLFKAAPASKMSRPTLKGARDRANGKSTTVEMSQLKRNGRKNDETDSKTPSAAPKDVSFDPSVKAATKPGTKKHQQQDASFLMTQWHDMSKLNTLTVVTYSILVCT